MLFVRSILLARWLPVEVFGVYGFAAAIVGLSTIVVNFGMGPAFTHRAPETEDEEQTAAVHFTLKLVFTLVWAVLLIAGAFIFSNGPDRVALLLLTVTSAGVQLAETPKLILVRRVVHRRLALVDLTSVLLSTLVTLGLAWRGVTLWALLATDLVGMVLSIVALYVWRPVWRPQLVWEPTVVRYFLRFGSQVFLGSAFAQALDRVDDLWTGSYLGKTALAFYSRAYSFARYPGVIIGNPIDTVAAGAYAELKGNRPRLSQAFFRFSAILVRGGFFLAGLMALIAPEFIRLAIGNKWLPMLDAFRLMLVYTLLVPLRKTVTKVFAAVGRPDKLIRVRFVQLVVLVIGLIVLGPRLGIVGVALAVDVMFVLGIAILLWLVRAYVDISLWRLFAVPGLSLGLGMLLARGAILLPGVLGSDWRTGIVKFAVFSTVYSAILLVFEWHQIVKLLSWVTRSVAKRRLFTAEGQEIK